MLDWRALLRRYMTDAARRDYSWSVPNRRFIDAGLYLPSIRSEGIDAIAVIVDTSGSLPAATLAEFWAELREVATELQPERVIVLQVDSAVQDAAEYTADDLPDEIVIRGRGGTDFRPGFAWLDEQGIRPGVCLYFTDMECSSYPETEPVFQQSGSTIPTRRRTGTASPGANASTSPWAEAPAIRPAAGPRQFRPPYPHCLLPPVLRHGAGAAVRFPSSEESAMSCDRTVFERAIHGAPAEALRQALEALAGLSFWIAWTADPDLHPEIPVSARCMRDAAAALRKAARLLDDAADRADPPPGTATRHPPATVPRRTSPGTASSRPQSPPVRRGNTPSRRRRAPAGRARAGRRGRVPRQFPHRRRLP